MFGISNTFSGLNPGTPPKGEGKNGIPRNMLGGESKSFAVSNGHADIGWQHHYIHCHSRENVNLDRG